LSTPGRAASSSLWLGLRSLLWTILLPGVFAGFLPWRYFGLSQVVINWSSPRHLLGLAAIGIGVRLLVACIWEFARSGRGTLSPVDPPTELVVQGLYRYVRNPMYLSVTTIVLGEALLIGSRALLVYWAVWFVVANLFVIGYEEPALRRRFGPAYEKYRGTVHRWLPRTPVFIAFLSGCAASTQSSTAVRETESACSFRSPTTCWSVSGRFPAVRSEPAAAPVDSTCREPPAVLASSADSTRNHR